MLAFITGASSGIGRDIARNLYKRGYNLILTARDEEKLLELKEELEKSEKIENTEKLKTQGNHELRKKLKKQENYEEYEKADVARKIKILTADLSKETEVFELYEKIKSEKIDIFINNAGLGTRGNFWETDINTELEMLKVNDMAMHILFKLILKDMLLAEKEDASNNSHSPKYILNVASLAGFMPGPRMSAYYATKAYMLNLTRGVYQELKEIKSNINVSVLCPGPVYTNFADRAGVNFKVKSLSSKYTAEYAIDKLFAKKLVIIPGFINKCAHIFSKLLPSKLIMKVTYRIQ